jgi:PAS domain S-box-containing protein
VLLVLAGAMTYTLTYRQRVLANALAEKTSELVVTNSLLAHDIRMRSSTEDTLRESESRFRRMFEQAGDGFVVVDMAGTIRAVNAVAAEIVGFAMNELEGRPVLDLISPEYHPQFRLAQIRGQLLAGQTIRGELLLLTRCEKQVPVELSARSLDRSSFLAVFRDLSARRQVDRTLCDQQERMRILADILPGLLLYIDRDERVQYANATAERGFAESPDSTCQTML